MTPPTASAVDTLSLVLEAADHEALFTLAGGLKPLSTGFWQGAFEVAAPDLSELRSVRAALAPLRNERWYADVHVFAAVHDGERAAHAFVVHRAALARSIQRFEAFWSPWGSAPDTHPSEVLAVLDRMPKADRWRGFGHLFGFPADAVDFFVAAGLAAAAGAEVGPGKDRRFVQISTFAADTGRFTYAERLDHERSAADDALADAAERILDAYTERRDTLRDATSLIAALAALDRRFEGIAASAAEIRDARSARPEVD